MDASSWVIWAQAPEVKAFRDERTLWLTAALAALLLAGAVILSWLQRWRKRQIEGDDRPADQLTMFRQMYEAGELSKEEYEKVRRRVAARVVGREEPAPAVKPPRNEPSPPAPSE